MGEGEWFSQFCGALRINAEKRGSISYRTGRIVGQLNYDLRDKLDSKSAYRFYVGSYGRSTAIPSVSDVDLLYELPYALYQRFHGHTGNGQSALLALVKNSIRNTYSVSDIAGDGQVVVINFDDGVRFEVLPAFENVDGSYTFADSNGGGSWRVCKPKHEMNAFSARNTACNGNLVELSRMARAWRDTNNVSMSGMLIDTLAYQFIANWSHRDKSYLYYDYLTRDFFNYLANLDTSQTYWLAPGSGSYVYRSDVFQFKARSAELRAIEAIGHQLKSENWSARQKYRAIYGTAFPA
ncbi:SMODS domain-containing nucleotidyltransferase [Burkholderia ubonensis]|uniref:Nucleotidyltransferase n=2 Tax=Burkholderia ubonensis TaxID=101571 RepID=A0AB74DDU6_9BURK|nr:nucleotidyltransferase [Burkholderia ubonensis]PAJ80638.1 nucleotidyltransferase [Burkholderia ubonensis]PAK00972.1 nucleotidyltransferase [Burkholderia ubonensis]RQP35022.1 nucleotidyltransferase [Burkholderia ubonensis]RQP37343.1 nucleotidyltransferase [Burkholderia ubonensis]RQP40950.1 nucleotidyltransferase [Burkholderia ubonensis]